MTTESMRENARAVLREMRGELLPAGDFINALARVVNHDKARKDATARGVLVSLDERRARR
jgi:hypothetical protein